MPKPGAFHLGKTPGRKWPSLDIAPEGRPFHPHITLGRVREGHRLPAGAIKQLEELPPSAPFLADQVVLFESKQTSAGPAYNVLLAQTLAG